MNWGLAFVLALLAVATLLVLTDAWREWQREGIRRAFRERVKRDIARDRLIHDYGVAEARDYETLMAWRDDQQQHYHRLGGGVVTGRAVPSAMTGKR